MSQIMLPPDIALAPWVDNFMVAAVPVGSGDIDFQFPASARTRLVVLIKGGGKLVEADGTVSTLPAAYIAGPKLAPRRYVIEAGSEFIITVLRAGCFTQFFNRPLNEFTRCVIPLDELVGDAECQVLLDRIHASVGAVEQVKIISNFLGAARTKVATGHQFFLPRLSEQHLAMPAKQLSAVANLSARQFERRFLANYGMSMRDFRRLVRYMSALNFVLNRKWETGVVTRIAQDSGYFDQAHFIRDFREFVGRAPGEFIRNRIAEKPENILWKDGTYNVFGV
jgi:AraC-like DNA-binding protein